ncbi:MAG: arylsulfatase [Planctomyces sp.]|nr:arylsulfatase [Planctomyces sp.]
MKSAGVLMNCLLAFAWMMSAPAVAEANVDNSSHRDDHRNSQPNIVLILCDDLGYGDVRCFHAESKIRTPELDHIAATGMRFTDAHSGSAVCTPTRYGLLTGRYAWRTRLQNGVLGGLSPALIAPNRLTLASMLKSAGYKTACVGKWHLGMNWVVHPGKQVSENTIESREQVWNVDYSQPATHGPVSAGFDEYFGISASLDMVPYAWIRNDRLTENPTEDRDFVMFFERDAGRTRKGPAVPGFDAADVLPELLKESVRIIETHATKTRDSGNDRAAPLFLYIPLASPHTPILPATEWQGKSGLNAYADFTMQTDDAIGQIRKSLEQNGLLQNTLLIVTSDNGCSPQADFGELRAHGHDPSAGFRGHKADIFEGGHRIPLIASWPGVTKPGSLSSRTTCLTDVFATVAEIVGVKLPPDSGEDSISFFSELKNPTIDRQQISTRPPVVHHSINGSFAIREAQWKLIFCADSGGWSEPRPGQKRTEKDLPPWQLYNLENDPAESSNVIADHPDVVQKLSQTMTTLISNGRSTEGSPQPNDVEVRRPTGL